MSEQDRSSETEKELLDNYSDDESVQVNSSDLSSGGAQLRQRHTPQPTQRLIFWILVILYAPLALFTAWAFLRQNTPCPHPDLLPSPARESNAVEYETRRLRISVKDSPFAGDPSPALDKAWHDMFENNNIRVSKHDLDRVNLSSLELADGSGYVAQLGFYHELHCLKRIRHWVYKDYYHKNDSPEQARENKAHIDHCIEMLRESSICHADTSLSTFRWLGGGDGHDSDPRPTAEDRALHQCVNWERLRPWISDRAVHLSHPGVLRKPGSPN